MARILLVDPCVTARQALQGILARGSHRLATVDTARQAEEFLRLNPITDLVFTELNLPGGNCLAFVQRLKDNPFLRLLPITIYAQQGDRPSVRRALELRIQNFLLKPYHDDDIFAEIEKTEVAPWRDRLFEETKVFARRERISDDELNQRLQVLHDCLAELPGRLQTGLRVQDSRQVAESLIPLRRLARESGHETVVTLVKQLCKLAEDAKWSAVAGVLEDLSLASSLIAHRLDPARPAPGFSLPEASTEQPFHRERELWLAAPAAGRTPLVSWPQMQQGIDSLAGCPVIASAAASFQMVANGSPACINPLMDIVARDPGLSTQMLIAAHQVHPSEDDLYRIEDARLAVGQLGEVRLQEQARALGIVAEEVMQLPPHFDWPRFWVFQRGVARIAQLICQDLEFYSLEPIARTAGQIHDIGKLLLAHLQPAGFQAILEHARKHRISLSKTETLYLSCTTTQLAGHFAERFGLSRRLAQVLRWVGNPEQATEDRNLVAIISLARDLCRHNQVGASGDPPLDHLMPLEQTTEWQILSEGLYPSFNLKKFEQKVHAYCGRLRTEFSGHLAGTVGELVASATP